MRIAVGGNARKAGKTSVICAILRALPEAGWTAIKISPHAHAPAAGGDTARFLAAGARRALLLAEPPAEWPPGNVIIESTSLRDADLSLLVIDGLAAESKPSAAAMLARADAIVVTRGEWADDARPVFHAPPPGYSSEALADYIRRRLIAAGSGPRP